MPFACALFFRSRSVFMIRRCFFKTAHSYLYRNIPKIYCSVQCWGSVTFWCGSGSVSPDPYLWLMDPDPTPFLIGCKNAKKKYFYSYCFLITCPQAHHLQSKKFNILLNLCVKILFWWHYFRPLNTFLRKGKDPDPHLWLMIRIREAQKHADPADPDPQHWFCLLLPRTVNLLRDSHIQGVRLWLCTLYSWQVRHF
jgi:hypothetical protein